ncbi:unnamed protein product, partial [Hymenolepis diminuta]
PHPAVIQQILEAVTFKIPVLRRASPSSRLPFLKMSMPGLQLKWLQKRPLLKIFYKLFNKAESKQKEDLKFIN